VGILNGALKYARGNSGRHCPAFTAEYALLKEENEYPAYLEPNWIMYGMV